VKTFSYFPSDWTAVLGGPSYNGYSFNVDFDLNRIRYVGNVANTPQFLQSVDALFLPSLVEGGPIVLLEAWASRVPFFMHATGLAAYFPDCVFIVSTEWSAQETASFVLESLQNTVLVHEKLECGFKLVQKFFSIDTVIKQWGEVLSALVVQRTQIFHKLAFNCLSEYLTSIEWIGSSCELFCPSFECSSKLVLLMENEILFDNVTFFYSCDRWNPSFLHFIISFGNLNITMPCLSRHKEILSINTNVSVHVLSYFGQRIQLNSVQVNYAN
jgi:hypothetical protein